MGVNSVAQFSSVNAVDDNAVVQCPKAGHAVNCCLPPLLFGQGIFASTLKKNVQGQQDSVGGEVLLNMPGEFENIKSFKESCSF